MWKFVNNTIIRTMNMNRNVCRLCLFKGCKQDFVDVFADNMYLVHKIKDCLSLPIVDNDSLPRTICHSCIEKVNQWRKFKEHSWNSNRILREFSDKKIQLLSGQRDFHAKNINILYDINSSTDLKKDQLVRTIPSSSKDGIHDKFEHTKATLLTNDYTCDYCSNTFSSLVDYLDHQAVHELEAIEFRCSLCDKKCTSRGELLSHEYEHNKGNIQQKCSVCGKMVKKRNINQHMNQHNDKFRCDSCGLRCNAPSVLAAHKLTVHTTHRPYCCSICGKQFNRLRNLREHTTLHSNERNFPCAAEGCAYTARLKLNLRLHVMRKHPDNKQETGAVCNECGKAFKTLRHLGDHTRRIHTKVKKHECRFCDMKFIDRHLLITHLMKHTGERPFQCKTCDKGFARADGLKNHIKTHDQRLSFSCNSCNKEFVTKQGRNRHKCTRQ